MFGFGKKKQEEVKPAEASKGYHSCVDSCEKDIENLETECENLRKDNLTLISRVTQLQASNKELNTERDTFGKELDEQAKTISEKNERIEELEERLKEADLKADGTPVKYASARKALTKAKLKQLRNALESAPAGAGGFGGSCSVYDKKTKRVSLVEFKSKQDALDILDRAEKGNVDIIM
jgi:predicted RNase H-like nuclease (RuvC/YqgF family)